MLRLSAAGSRPSGRRSACRRRNSRSGWKIKQPSLVALEQSEAKGTIELATLRRVAEALDCTLVHALVPNKPLETMVRDRARAFTRKRRAHVEHSMLLEDQKVKGKDAEARLDEIVRETNPAPVLGLAVTDLFEEPDNATPLTHEERRELIPAHIAYRQRAERSRAGKHRPRAGLGARPQSGPAEREIHKGSA